MTDWFAQPHFWERVYPLMFSAERDERAHEEVANLLELVGMHRGRALDLCCGPGRHSVPLAKAGFDVTGLDISEFLLERARARAQAAKVDIDWVHEDMRNYAMPEGFDLVINLYTSFGYFAQQSDDLKVLRNIVSSLTEGGAVVLDVVGKEALAGQLPLERQPTVEHDGSLLIERVEVVDDWSRAKVQWMLIRGDSVERFDFEHTLYSGRELRELMNWAGLSDVSLYGGLDGRPYGPGAQRLVAVGRR
ncbi:MAG: class I SAM-dependent methyltransferase [Nannocystaceae bacterium]|nr:class I SAM-dependent methyltransferase [Nannocystaceae bacterium]